MGIRIASLAAAFGLWAGAAFAGTELLMFEEEGCVWCERWNSEVGVVYDRTDEGAAAPLRRADIRTAPPDGVTLKSAPRFSPTFVLLENGIEVGRIEGYPGQDFFWGMLGEMIRSLPEREGPDA